MKLEVDQKLAFIGCGNFASGIIRGLVQSGYSASNIWATRRRANLLQPLNQELGVNIGSDSKEAMNNCDYIFLCPRPQQLLQFFNESLEFYQDLTKPVISVMAGVDLQLLQRYLPQAPIVRAMPNLPSQVQQSMTGLYANSKMDSYQCGEVSTIFNLIGDFIWLDSEHKLHSFTALCGSGVAYFYYLMTAMEQSAEEYGFSAAEASQIVRQTAVGASDLLRSDVHTAASALAEIQLPGGTTEAAINAMQFHRADDSIKLAVRAAGERSVAIAEELRAQYQSGAESSE